LAKLVTVYTILHVYLLLALSVNWKCLVTLMPGLQSGLTFESSVHASRKLNELMNFRAISCID